MDESLIDAIIVACSKTKNFNEVLPISGVRPEEPHQEFCLQFAERVARRYLHRDIEFELADAAMNWLHAYCYVAENCAGEMPPLALEIYDAFDSGEYYHNNDDRTEDPELKYTRPQIRSIVETKL